MTTAHAPATDVLPALSRTVSEYLEFAKSFRGLADATIIAYRRDINRFLDWAAAHDLTDDVTEITRQQVQKYLNTLSGLSPSTVRRAAYSLSGLFRHLKREGTVALNPASGLLLPKRRRSLPNVPSAQ